MKDRIFIIIAALGLGLATVGLIDRIVSIQGWSRDFLFSTASVLVGLLLGLFSTSIIYAARRIRTAPRVFISSSPMQKSDADSIAASLRKAGAHLWVDLERLSPGEEFIHAINAAIKDADVVVALIDKRPSSVQDQEIDAALDARKKIIPVLVGDTVVPESLRRFNPISLGYLRSEIGMQELVSAIGKEARAAP